MLRDPDVAELARAVKALLVEKAGEFRLSDLMAVVRQLELLDPAAATEREMSGVWFDPGLVEQLLRTSSASASTMSSSCMSGAPCVR